MGTGIAKTFGLSTQIIIGDGLASVLQDRKRVFIVTDKFMVESGKIEYVTSRLCSNATYSIFSDVSVDPDIKTVSEGVGIINDFAPDAVVCFGGGSPIDAAKAIVFFAQKIKAFEDIPFVAIPTTSGTGSEVSKFAVITDTVKKVKYPLVDDKLIPDYAVLDASLTISVPPSITADTGMDVFTHAVEAFVSKDSSDFSNASAEMAIKLVIKNLYTAYSQPDNIAARQSMHNASCLAGSAFSNAGLGICHSMAHALGARFHIPHGRANAILLPYVMSFNAGCADKLTETAKAYAEISSLIGMEAASVRQSALNLIKKARRLVESMKIPPSIKEAGVSESDFMNALSEISAAALADKCTATNPRKCTLDDLTAVFKKAYIGKMP